jgi:protocatechuate 3,4-dioxygenase beta subunit
MTDDDQTVGRTLARREVLLWFGTGAGAAVLATAVPDALARVPRSGRPRVSAASRPGDDLPACIVRPEQVAGPFFVDEKLDRSDIRSDPGTGTLSPGARLTLAFRVSRLATGTCTPFAGVQVDLWHCDALGLYSDVVDPRFDTTGLQFLRGYQTTDASGVARFVTIFPGWYQGRAVHLHFKLRTDAGAGTALEFTSQLYFDDTLADAILAAPPYAAAGTRTVRNANDGIYQQGGSQLLLAVAADGTGGYESTFDIGLLVDDTCTTVADCLTALRSVLPDPDRAANPPTRRTAKRLRRRIHRVARLLERARYDKATARLDDLLALSRQAAAAGTLGAALGPIEAAVAVLLAHFPA